MVEMKHLGQGPATPVAGPRPRKALGACMIEAGVISHAQLDSALRLQDMQNAPLGEILVSEGWATRQDVLSALSHQNGLQIADLKGTPPAPALCGLRPVDFWLEHNVVPWVRIGPVLLVATARPDLFDPVRQLLCDCAQTILPVLATPDQIDAAIADRFAQPLARAAESRAPAAQSCRNWSLGSRLGPVSLGLVAIAGLGVWPAVGWSVLFSAAVVTLVLFLILRLAGLLAYLVPQRSLGNDPDTSPSRLPCVSILVPLHNEREIAGALIRRLQRLTYPKALLDVILVLEENDAITRKALNAVELPSWIRTLEVPDLGNLTTKPRAMNYALDFCRGEILGVWDAEDAPQPDQIETVVHQFARVPDEVVCLQGVLDYYNPRTNWRSRCFTVEYSSWFRVILPGIARLGLVVPLGGTTFYFRRDKLVELGGWDAHNVTEDADLGVRLSRAGYRTEIVDTATYEEANFRAWPWVKQRSRWLKGFMVTYLVHMRTPFRLLCDLGPWRFLGVQAFFLGTVGQFLLAPVLWSFWLASLGLEIPFQTIISPQVLRACVLLCLAAEITNITVGAFGVIAGKRRFLVPWIPTMALYYPLGVVAAYKALWELVAKPFFWDKTQHGQAPEEHLPPAGAIFRDGSRPASTES